ncbi:hypothetical protein [Magnetospirillum fulvum]|uniref:Lipoprotein n=1 Tax=Magnetospirillum fulvum MGU-K5 TaxID=1316936 RepID=S9S3L5_MAGFU|nr:hypothetical protein [Magnetospirillum fulvum]EPY00527.1 hypothetical protein K678_15641 [Magnetospirillum fulvum MGU-K5]
MHLFRPLLLVAAVTSLAACSIGEPFVDRDTTFVITSPVISKPKRAGYNGSVTVCYTDDTLPATRDALAAEACAAWGLTAVQNSVQLWQCRLTVPHKAIYLCIDPAMRYEDGSYVNPFSESAVADWRKAHPTQPAAPADAPSLP